MGCLSGQLLSWQLSNHTVYGDLERQLFYSFNFRTAPSPKLAIKMDGAGREGQEFYSAMQFDALT
jgi:hypothetical protein